MEFFWDGTDKVVWTRTDDASLFSNPIPYVGGASTYSSPFDTISPWKDMEIITRSDAGRVVSIPKFYYKLRQTTNNGMSIQISMTKHTGFQTSPAHMNRGDGKGERDVIYVGRYHSTTDYRSVVGLPITQITRDQARTAISSLGVGVYQLDFLTRFTIWLLYLVEFANWNSQITIGYGCGDNASKQTTGYTDTMPYHTGTMLSSRTEYGASTQYRYIEGLWDNVYDYIDGCYYNNLGLRIILSPNNSSDTSGGTFIGLPTSGFPSQFKVYNTVSPFIFYPVASSGHETRYSCDYWSFWSSDPCLFGGGSYGNRLDHGLFYINSSKTNSAFSDLGCRLMVLPQ